MQSALSGRSIVGKHTSYQIALLPGRTKTTVNPRKISPSREISRIDHEGPRWTWSNGVLQPLNQETDLKKGFKVKKHVLPLRSQRIVRFGTVRKTLFRIGW